MNQVQKLSAPACHALLPFQAHRFRAGSLACARVGSDVSPLRPRIATQAGQRSASGDGDSRRGCQRMHACGELRRPVLRSRIERSTRATIAGHRIVEIVASVRIHRLVSLLRREAGPCQIAVDQPGNQLLTDDRLQCAASDHHLARVMFSRPEVASAIISGCVDRRNRLSGCIGMRVFTTSNCGVLTAGSCSIDTVMLLPSCSSSVRSESVKPRMAALARAVRALQRDRAIRQRRADLNDRAFVRVRAFAAVPTASRRHIPDRSLPSRDETRQPSSARSARGPSPSRC